MRILDRLPVFDNSWRTSSPGGPLEVRPYQIIITVSIASQDVVVLPENALRFPAILDTGNNHNFAIRHEQFQAWVGTDLPRRGQVRVGGSLVPLHAATVWIHPNRSGSVRPSGQPPFSLKLEEGVAVYPADVTNPARLPILGLRGIVTNRLRLTIRGARRSVTLCSAPRAKKI
jgi:hypothetical protein